MNSYLSVECCELYCPLISCEPMARSVEDAALMLNVISVYDKLDINSVAYAAEYYRAFIKLPVSSMRVGSPGKLYFDDLDRAIGESVEAALGVIGAFTQDRGCVAPDDG